MPNWSASSACVRCARPCSLPIVAIGGIDYDNAGEVIDAGADALAVISAVAGDPQPALAARELALLFNRRRPAEQARVLTIAGSDSGGGAGIQADLKTITLLGSFGMSAITVLTAQNTRGVHGVLPGTGRVRQEADRSWSWTTSAPTRSRPACSTAPTSSPWSPNCSSSYGLAAVVDPVMIAKGGAPLLREDAMAAVRERAAAADLSADPQPPRGRSPDRDDASRTLEEMEEAARRLQRHGSTQRPDQGGAS